MIFIQYLFDTLSCYIFLFIMNYYLHTLWFNYTLFLSLLSFVKLHIFILEFFSCLYNLLFCMFIARNYRKGDEQYINYIFCWSGITWQKNNLGESTVFFIFYFQRDWVFHDREDVAMGSKVLVTGLERCIEKTGRTGTGSVCPGSVGPVKPKHLLPVMHFLQQGFIS